MTNPRTVQANVKQIYVVGDRVQLRVGSKPRGTVKARVFPNLYDVVFDRKDTLGRKHWLCEPVELEAAMICKATGRGFIMVVE